MRSFQRPITIHPHENFWQSLDKQRLLQNSFEEVLDCRRHVDRNVLTGQLLAAELEPRMTFQLPITNIPHQNTLAFKKFVERNNGVIVKELLTEALKLN